MTASIVLAAGLVLGVDWRLLAMAAGAVWVPMPTAVAVAAAAVVGRRVQLRAAVGSEGRFAETVVGELRAGASLRASLRTACHARGDCEGVVRRLDVGLPLGQAVNGLAGVLPTIGRAVEVAVAAGAGGGRMLPVFEELMIIAADEEQSRAEVRTATAQVRASMWVLVGLPVAVVTWVVASGRVGRLLALPGGAIVAGAGAFLFVTGAATMAWLGRRR